MFGNYVASDEYWWYVVNDPAQGCFTDWLVCRMPLYLNYAERMLSCANLFTLCGTICWRKDGDSQK